MSHFICVFNVIHKINNNKYIIKSNPQDLIDEIDRRNKADLKPTGYGVITNATQWIFMRMNGDKKIQYSQTIHLSYMYTRLMGNAHQLAKRLMKAYHGFPSWQLFMMNYSK